MLPTPRSGRRLEARTAVKPFFLSEPDRWRVSSGPNAWMLTLTGNPAAQWVIVQGVLRHWTVVLDGSRCTTPFAARVFELPIEEKRLDIALIQSPQIPMNDLPLMCAQVLQCLRPGGQLIISDSAPLSSRIRGIRCLLLFRRLGLVNIRLVPLTGKLRRVPAAMRDPTFSWLAALATGRYALSGFRPHNTARPLRLDKSRKLSKPMIGTTATVRGVAARSNKGIS